MKEASPKVRFSNAGKTGEEDLRKAIFYINDKIDILEKEVNEKLPRYKNGVGLSLGGQVQQFFAIFYLYKLHHYIIHDLHLKYMLSYMDDYVIFSNDLNYLKICKNKIIDFIILLILLVKNLIDHEVIFDINLHKYSLEST